LLAVEVHYCAYCKAPLTFESNVLIVRCTYCGHINSKIQADIGPLVSEPEIISSDNEEVGISGSSSSFGILGVIIAILMIAVASAVGLMVISTTSKVLGVSGNSTQNSAALNQTVNNIYAAWPIIGVLSLGFLAASVVMAMFVR